MGNAIGKRHAGRTKRLQCQVLVLVAAAGIEEAERRVVAEAVVQGEMRDDVPTVFGVESKALNVLGEGAVGSSGVGHYCVRGESGIIGVSDVGAVGVTWRAAGEEL